jgi:hypothetical protein
MIDEQRLRARLAALETAHMVHGFVADGYVKSLLEIAERLEEWIMRPSPADADAAHRRTAGQHPRCDVVWRNDDGIGHMCGWLPGHVDHVGHLCSCGDRLDMTS